MTTVTWIGKSGQKYTFELYVKGTEFKPLSGLYIFCRPLGTSQFEALYVGETQSLYDRINTNPLGHDGFKRASGIGFTHIAVLQCAGDAQRLAIETDLRHGLNPVCNAQNVPLKA